MYEEAEHTISGASERYDSVLDAAESCYDRKGWANATMEEIAGVAGVSRGYIYKHFRSKEGLMLAILVRRAEMYNGRARRFIDAQPTLEDALVEGIMLGVKLAHRDQYFGRLVGAATSDPEHSIPGAMAAARDATARLWRPVLESASSRGELREGVDIGDVIDWITIVELGLLANRNAGDVSDAAQERQIRSLFVPAVVTARTVEAL
jgi:AcrR family transcriptional regulator